MDLFHFNNKTAKHITHDKSDFLLQPILHIDTEARMSMLTLKADGIVGYHQADVPQLMLIIDGEGWIRTDMEAPELIHKGTAVFWEKGEWHETRTDTGLVAIVMESKRISREQIRLHVTD